MFSLKFPVPGLWDSIPWILGQLFLGILAVFIQLSIFGAHPSSQTAADAANAELQTPIPIPWIFPAAGITLEDFRDAIASRDGLCPALLKE